MKACVQTVCTIYHLICLIVHRYWPDTENTPQHVQAGVDKLNVHLKIRHLTYIIVYNRNKLAPDNICVCRVDVYALRRRLLSARISPVAENRPFWLSGKSGGGIPGYGVGGER